MNGVILAGGQARRMGGGDKPLITLAGRTLLARVIERVRPQVAALALSANGDPVRFAGFGLPVIVDSVPGSVGPLAGVLAGMDWSRHHHPECRWLISVAGDTPLVPTDLVARLLAAVEREGAEVACAFSAGRIHPAVALWPVAAAEILRHTLVVEGQRRVEAFAGRFRRTVVEWPVETVDPFVNLNTPQDVAALAAGFSFP
ncbi:Molybdenum cofactor guanylyltransferase [uncultured Gammaproteobacteria bacterium]